MNTNSWESVIGLEIHVQLATFTKLFSSSPTVFGSEPNTQASEIDLGLPGVLPVLNKEAISFAIKFGCAIDAKISNQVVFARKNYFYPDLPKGYQISQLDDPIVGEGKVKILLGDEEKTIGITRAHLEEDAGKSIHDLFNESSAIDLNRAGTCLLEIVSEPDLRSANEAVEYLKKIHKIITFLGISDGNMSQGSMRCDANVSMRKFGDDKLGTRTELKNINSFKFVEKAINYEISRQIKELEKGNSIKQETRLYDSTKNTTRSMRSKEEANDYRYFPEPDLIPIRIPKDLVNEIKQNLPELPEALKKRFIDSYNLSDEDADLIIANKETASFFEGVLSHNVSAKSAINWITGGLFALMNKNDLSILDSKITPEHIAEIIKNTDNQKISGPSAKKLLELLWESGGNVEKIIIKEGLEQISNDNQVEKILDEVILENQKQFSQLKEGKDRLQGFFVGQVMKKTSGSASPQVVNKLLKEKLSK
ncbi:MAG: Asp-tRNA(Asn)/Glu-tRNA(Gln) amidotransferase subunit GatB [Gammaproteobacteria bacterium]|nr:MAG: Asp-tRNA(Asn)/Glu-tRNA(Gln) amidotransferase subunit GatB [Gammaproteobacteria bacterium]